jgi:hypothetical protein
VRPVHADELNDAQGLGGQLFLGFCRSDLAGAGIRDARGLGVEPYPFGRFAKIEEHANARERQPVSKGREVRVRRRAAHEMRTDGNVAEPQHGPKKARDGLDPLLGMTAHYQEGKSLRSSFDLLASRSGDRRDRRQQLLPGDLALRALDDRRSISQLAHRLDPGRHGLGPSGGGCLLSACVQRLAQQYQTRASVRGRCGKSEERRKGTLPIPTPPSHQAADLHRSQIGWQALELSLRAQVRTGEPVSDDDTHG